MLDSDMVELGHAASWSAPLAGELPHGRQSGSKLHVSVGISHWACDMLPHVLPHAAHISTPQCAPALRVRHWHLSRQSVCANGDGSWVWGVLCGRAGSTDSLLAPPVWSSSCCNKICCDSCEAQNRALRAADDFLEATRTTLIRVAEKLLRCSCCHAGSFAGWPALSVPCIHWLLVVPVFVGLVGTHTCCEPVCATMEGNGAWWVRVKRCPGIQPH
jgi:hypothetical protein